MTDKRSATRLLTLGLLLVLGVAAWDPALWSGSALSADEIAWLEPNERQNLEDVRYLIWLDQAVRSGEIDDYDGPRWPLRPQRTGV
ncbi:MAG: hypothetical protein R3190_00490 [Thermoanaerobaculia bacterium]|nr:hypothetical protein [Thermoanaerobaculia bacterium]